MDEKSILKLNIDRLHNILNFLHRNEMYGKYNLVFMKVDGTALLAVDVFDNNTEYDKDIFKSLSSEKYLLTKVQTDESVIDYSRDILSKCLLGSFT